MSGTGAGAPARRLAIEALVRIDAEGAYANLVTPALLDRSGLEARDRHFVTELVYGTTRWRRALDHLIDRHRQGRLDPPARAALRIGVYQLGWLGVPPHAAVDATVSAAPRPVRGLVNAVLRKVAADVTGGLDQVAWPDEATRRSYPDWVVAAVSDVLGADAAGAALDAMNRPAITHEREDGYVQDPASRAVVDLLDARPGALVLDVCAAPGGKATDAAGRGATVVAADRNARRAGLVAANARKVGVPARIAVVTADGTAPPLRRASFDAVLVDAPCTGLGVLRRRPDARWRIDADAPARLAVQQRALLVAALPLVRPGGRLVYSACTLTREETVGVLDAVDPTVATIEVQRLDPPDEERDGMFSAAWRVHEAVEGAP